ncbi:MAG TPA: hypothetical protein VGO21_05735, partial [Candidatus Paceibacterota bacterium]|nr:hypothetical protein [Candidatus Paceibacterota bacterium]
MAKKIVLFVLSFSVFGFGAGLVFADTNVNWVDSNNNSLQIIGNVGIGLSSPAAQLDVLSAASAVGLNLTGTALSLNSHASGTNAPNILTVLGATGQATSFDSIFSRGGVGGGISLIAGTGGDNSDSNGTSGINHRGGIGGTLTLSSGAGGNATNTSFGLGRGGSGGDLNIIAGSGGTSAVERGGGGGRLSLIGGNGGVAISGQTNSGFGGTSFLLGGNGGDNSNSGGSAGSGGDITIDAGFAGNAYDGATPGVNGVITLGISYASAI